MSHEAGSHHVGCNLSIVEILVALLEEGVWRSSAPLSSGKRDAFVLSKGHASLAYYLALAEAGRLSLHELRSTWRRNGTRLCEHAHSVVPGVDVSTGSLGHGLSIGAGLALGLRTLGRSAYVLLGDGECGAGQIWEAAAFASSRKLGNLVAIVDQNRLQALGAPEEILSARLGDKFEAFGWECAEVDGHDVTAIRRALARPSAERPLAILARTQKGRGVSFMEGRLEWHYRRLTDEERDRALDEVGR